MTNHPAYKIRCKCYHCDSPATKRRGPQYVCEAHAEAIDDRRLLIMLDE